jgi:hypothetical protein
MPADGHTLPHKGGISARPAGCTDETLHQFALLKKRARMNANVQVRRDCETIGALPRPATEKRQGTKSREVGYRLGSKRYEDCTSAPASMEGMTSE